MRIPAFSKRAQGLTPGLVITKNPFTGVTGKGFGANISELNGCMFDARRYLMEQLEEFTVVAGKEHLRRNIDPEKQRLIVLSSSFLKATGPATCGGQLRDKP